MAHRVRHLLLLGGQCHNPRVPRAIGDFDGRVHEAVAFEDVWPLAIGDFDDRARTAAAFEGVWPPRVPPKQVMEALNLDLILPPPWRSAANLAVQHGCQQEHPHYWQREHGMVAAAVAAVVAVAVAFSTARKTTSKNQPFGVWLLFSAALCDL